MKKLMLLAVCAMAIMMSCNKKGQTAGAAAPGDSTVTDSVVVEKKAIDLEGIAKAIEGATYLTKFENGVAFVNRGEEKYYIDLQGNRVEQPHEETDPNELEVSFENDKYGYVDGTGKVVIPHQYSFACSFSDGMAAVYDDKGYAGYINTKGELVIPCKYESPAERNVNDFHEGLCAVMVDGEHEWFSYIDKTGKQAFPGVFSRDGDFSEGLAAVATPGADYKYGYIDHSGKMVITLPQGWWGRKFGDGVAQISQMDSCFIIDKTGSRLFQIDNEVMYSGNDIEYSEGLAIVFGKGKYEKKWGYMDKTGRITFCLAEENAER